MTVPAKAAPKAAAARVGRPARIDVQAIIAAAIDIGLERLTLKKVADRLGVAVTSLYRHVNSSEGLVSLAAIQLAMRRRLPERTDVHWSELAVSYAEILYESLIAEPQLIAELTKGNIGADLEIEFLDQFLAALHAQGFSAPEGVMLHRALGMLTIGAAVGVFAASTVNRSKITRSVAVRRALAERDEDELPFVRSALPVVLDLRPEQWRSALYSLLAGIAASRGETLPPSQPRAAVKDDENMGHRPNCVLPTSGLREP